MALIVEDGTGRPDADSYLSLEELKQIWTDLGYDFETRPDDKIEISARVATRWVDNTYRSQFPGFQVRGRGQSREWPRTGGYTEVSVEGRDQAFTQIQGYGYYGGTGLYQIPENEIPREIKAAVAEAAYRALKKPGSLSPDLKRGGAIQSVGAGSAQVSYFAGAPANTVFQEIDLVLAPLLIAANSYSGRVARG
jgi:hypothetical protein